MASIKDALEESLQEQSSILKFIVFAIPLFFVVSYPKFTAYWVLLIFTAILLLGFMLKCTYNVRTGEMKVLPSFNIVSILWTGIVGLIALTPITLISYFASKFIIEYASNYIAADNIIKVISYITYGIFASMILTTYLLYANKFKLSDAFNFKMMSTYCIDILIAVIFMLVQAVIVDSLIIAPVTYIIWLFFGIPHPVAIFFWCVVAILNLAMLGHYMGQISYEIIETKEKQNQ